ncbi:MAG: biosynthetic-type acetolactate synthase large subunit [Oscillospiraceae bacterium]|nr:biosynthetic-type acetolactate synthase large subunit [Oscillospiraceae bacterium]
MQLKGAQILIETLVSLGVDTVFGYPGGAVLDIYDELYKSSDRINHVITAHEQGAAHAADGYARVKGKPGVVIATSGPGATNLVTGIANAYLDSIPLVAITGNVAVALLGRDSFQEVDIVGITQPIVKHSYIVRDVNVLEETIREAFQIAAAGRPGPVLIDIPKSVQAQEAEYKGEAKREEKVVKPLPDLTQALELIAGSKKPYLYFGGGVIAANAEAEAVALAERLSAPMGLSVMGLSAIPHKHPLNLGMCGMHGQYAASVAQSKADLVIAAGVRFSDRATGNVDKYTRNCTVIHIDIDRAEIGKNVRPNLSLNGDVKAILTALLEQLPQKQNPAWLEEIEALKAHVPSTPLELFAPHNIIRAVHSHVPEDTVIATDVGQHQMWVAQAYPFEKSRTLLTSGGLGTMGYGLGAAIGGCMGSGRKPTVHFTSDGSFGMNLNELATAVTQGLPLLSVILNNGVLGMVRQWQGIFYGERYSQTTLNRQTDFVKLAQAFGAKGARAHNLEELHAALEQWDKASPLVLECLIDMDEKVLPMIPPGGAIEDIRIN